MTRLTKSEIERLLLSGNNVEWRDANGKEQRLSLTTEKSRRLLAYLLTSNIRKPTGLPSTFVDGLSTAYEANFDPAATHAESTTSAAATHSWRLTSILTEGFGGLNSWQGDPFNFDFDGKSLLLEGPNGSGKSSLVGAILWALSGERPRDQANVPPNEMRPVFSSVDKPAGEWPPIACYPPSVHDLNSPARVHVELTFQNSEGSTSKVERTLLGGKVTSLSDPTFYLPSILIETGLLMPARMSQLRLDEGHGRLTDAVQKLTGLDDLVSIGLLVDGLCHQSREYRSFKRKDLQADRKNFTDALSEARAALTPVDVEVPAFVPKDTADDHGLMSTFGKQLVGRAAELTQVISGDLAEGLDLSSPKTQQEIVGSLAAAKEQVEAGIESLEAWKFLQSIAQALTPEASSVIKLALSKAATDTQEAIRLLERSAADPKFQLKALAAKWHEDHEAGSIENCPLCERGLQDSRSLANELEELRSVGDAAARSFDDNVNAIFANLDDATPILKAKIDKSILTLNPRTLLMDALNAAFVSGERYDKYLVRFSALVKAALTNVPPGDHQSPKSQPEQHDIALLDKVSEKMAVLEQLLVLADWFNTHSAHWKSWWDSLAGSDSISSETTTDETSKRADPEARETLSSHVSRLSEALATAEPYRSAATAMRRAWSTGKTVAEIEVEVNRRAEIAEHLQPLKDLKPLCEAVARDAIEGLSGRISELLDRIHLTEELRFQSAHLKRKDGLIVRGEFTAGLQIDATLVANTSWLRAVLWAFLFSLREEAVEQLGFDSFPVLVVDDPQSTFDAQHRHMWARYVVDLQSGPSKVQLLLTTYDENFLGLIKVDGIEGRQALIGRSGSQKSPVSIYEGESLDREWTKALEESSPKAAVSYMISVREYVEGMLKLMLRGEDSDISSLSLGTLRDRLSHYHQAQRAPWNQSPFKKLVAVLDHGRSEVRYIEGSHHSTGRNYGMGEASSVEEFWRTTLRPSLDRACRTAREHRLVHGGLHSLHAPPPQAHLPEGYQDAVRAIPLRVLGKAAALSDGRAADGNIDMSQFTDAAQVPVILGRHFAYRLTAPTLEPVARQGDILLVREHGEPSPNSLVVAISEERLLARRFEIADNHTDVGVLAAQAINPRQIASPVIAHRSTFRLHKVIAVLYDNAPWQTPTQSNDEVCDCGGKSILSRLTTNALGLVEVAGQSAEPYALDKQYLIVKEPITSMESLDLLQGKPIIASDSDGNTYFKRLHCVSENDIVLESLDGAGTYSPIILSFPGSVEICLDKVWPVGGVLFESPV